MDGQGLLSYVKKVIHSLIVSTPERMNIEQLKRDYASVEGVSLPFCKLGFKDIESFLRSIPDTVVLVGNGPMAQVLAKTHARNAHIQQLVQCQKKSNKSRGKPKYRSRHYYSSQQTEIVFVNEQPKRMPDNNNNNRSSNHSKSSISYSTQQSRQAPVQAQKKFDAETNSFYAAISKLSFDDEDSSTDERNSFDIHHSVGEKEIKSKIKSNRKHRSPVRLVTNLPEAESDNSCDQYQSSNEGCQDNAVPAHAEDDRVLNLKIKLEIEASEVDYLSSNEGSESDAIPAYAVDERVLSVEYPKNAVRFDQRLPKRDIHKKLALYDRIEVQLVMISSPHRFSFWVNDEQYEDYENMWHNMQRLYNGVNETMYTIPLFLIMVGHLGAVLYKEKEWQRVQVLSINTGDTKNIEVEFVDTGERKWICHSDLKYLFKQFAILPPQYWTGRLACVMPRHGHFFSLEASNYFSELVSYRRLYAKIEKINDVDNTVCMILVDPDVASLIVNINVALIESGWVRRSYKP